MERVVNWMYRIYITQHARFCYGFDYNRFWQQATEGREVVKAIAYATDRGDASNNSFKNLARYRF